MSHERHHGIRPGGPPIELRVRIERIQGRGVMVSLVEDPGQEKFWLPGQWPVVWSAAPAPGETVTIKMPRWLAAKHRPVVSLRVGGQASLSPLFNAPPGIDPVNAKGPIPMAYDQNERPPQGRGALFVNKQKQQPNHPDRRGDLTLPAGYVLTLANGTALTLAADAKLEVVGWLKDTKSGEKYLSISAKPHQERRPAEHQPATNSYAQATGRSDRPTFDRSADDPIPF
jgi:hypothetical protein